MKMCREAIRRVQQGSQVWAGPSVSHATREPEHRGRDHGREIAIADCRRRRIAVGNQRWRVEGGAWKEALRRRFDIIK